jgi:hypothetical protein
LIKSIWNNRQYLIATLYTWIVSTYFGAILLDIVYASIARRALKPSETASMFSQVADSPATAALPSTGGCPLCSAPGTLGEDKPKAAKRAGASNTLSGHPYYAKPSCEMAN